MTAAGNSNYIFNSSGLQLTDSNDPDISVNVGDKLIFDVSAASAAHPFAIVDALGSSNQYLAENKVSGVTGNAEPAIAQVVWDLTGVSPGEYYYICTLHSGMRGKITVSAESSV